MAADGDAGLVDVAVGLAVAGFDDLLDVDVVPVGEPGELVGQPDVDVPVGGFGQLRQLGGLRRAEVPDAVGAGQVRALFEVEHGLVEGDARRGGRLVDAADELGVAAQVGEDPAGQHPLREKTRWKSSPGVRPEPSASIGAQRVRVVPTGSVVS